MSENQKNIEQELIKLTGAYHIAKERLRMHELAETFLGGGSWVFNLSEQTIIASKGWQQVHGFHKSFFTMDELMPIAHPDDVPEIEKNFSNSLESGAPYHLTHRIIKQDTGDIRTIKAYAEVMETDCEGRPLKLFGMIQDITDLIVAEEKLRFLATHDLLTSLPTRIVCVDHIILAIAAAKRNKKMAAVLFLDLDGFKRVNDERGHNIGDLLLKKVATRLLSTVRETDTVSRFGGDEFVVVLGEMETKTAISTVATKIIQALASPFDISGQQTSTSTSIGIALFPDNGNTPETLLKEADAAMYAVKTSGKNNFRFADEG